MKKILIPLMIVALIASLSIGAFAAESPTASVQFNVNVNVDDSKAGTANKVVNSDGTITLTASANSGYNFSKWVVDGEYEIIEGSLTSNSITIKPLSDLTANATYETASEEPTQDDTGNTNDIDDTNGNGSGSDDIGATNNSGTSPITGNAPIAAVAVTLVAAVGAAYVAKKNLRK